MMHVQSIFIALLCSSLMVFYVLHSLTQEQPYYAVKTQVMESPLQPMPILPRRDGANGDVACDCNIGNFNNQLLSCKVCVAYAYALNRRAVVRALCEQDAGYGNTGPCTSLSSVLDEGSLQQLIPVTFEQPGRIAQSACATAHAFMSARDVTLHQLSEYVVPASEVVCYGGAQGTAWMVDSDATDKTCRRITRVGAQIEQLYFDKIAVHFQSGGDVLSIVDATLARINGVFVAVHVRRSQAWIPGETDAWATEWPGANWPMQRVVNMLRVILARYPECQGRVFLATNSQDASEIDYFMREFPKTIRVAAESTSNNIVRVAADVHVAGKAIAFLGTPGSTFTENVRHLIKGNVSVFCDHEPFQDVVLAISFSFNYYANIPLFKWMYQPFGTLYFCGDIAAGEAPHEVHLLHLERGWFQHRCLLAAMKDHPDAIGYMASNDDTIVQWWNMYDLDLSRVWSESCKRWADIRRPGLIRNTYCNKYQPEDCFQTAIDGIGDVFPYGKPALMQAYPQTTAGFRDMLSLYTGGPEIFCEGDPDFAYIPASLSKAFMETVVPFDNTGVAFAYIYGSVTRGIISDDSIVKPDGLWMWGYDRDHWAELFGTSAAKTVVHPMKLSMQDQREAVVNRFSVFLTGIPP